MNDLFSNLKVQNTIFEGWIFCWNANRKKKKKFRILKVFQKTYIEKILNIFNHINFPSYSIY